MNKKDQSPKQNIPKTRNFWLRFAKYFAVSIITSYFLYWTLSQVDPATLQPANNKREALAFLLLAMLNIMSPEYWGWLSFLVNISATLWGDWHNFRWQSFPKEKVDEPGKV